MVKNIIASIKASCILLLNCHCFCSLSGSWIGHFLHWRWKEGSRCLMSYGLQGTRQRIYKYNTEIKRAWLLRHVAVIPVRLLSEVMDCCSSFSRRPVVHKWHFVYHRPAASMYEIKSIQLPIYCKCDVCCAICFVKKIYCGLPLRYPQLRNVASTAAYLFIINSLRYTLC